jgi:hypothetical protein
VGVAAESNMMWIFEVGARLQGVSFRDGARDSIASGELVSATQASSAKRRSVMQVGVQQPTLQPTTTLTFPPRPSAHPITPSSAQLGTAHHTVTRRSSFQRVRQRVRQRFRTSSPTFDPLSCVARWWTRW